MRTRYQEYTGTAKIAVMALLLAFSCGLTYYFHVKFEMGIVFTHFFYVPIILACIWWKRRGLVVAVFLTALLIISRYAFRLPLVSVDDYFRAFMFIVIGFVVVVLSQRITKQVERVKHLNAVLRAIRNVNQLITREKDRGRLLQGACDNLTETRGYYNAWIAVLDEAGSLVATAEGSLGTLFSPMVERLRQGNLPHCAGKALKQSGVVVTADPLSECTGCPLSSVGRNRADMIVRLEHGGVIYGLLSVSVPAKLAEYAEEHDLLSEAAGDIAFALHDIELAGQQELAEKSLRESEEQYRAVFESAADALLIFDFDGTIMEANPAACSIYGYSHEDIIGLSGKDIVHPDYYHMFESFKNQVKTTGQFFAESVDVHKDGSTFDVGVRGAIFTFKGKPHLLAVVRDITERKQAEREKQTLEEQLRQSVKMEAIGRLAGGIAHDFNNMLAIIQGYADLMLKSMSDDDRHRADVESIRTASKRAAILTRQLLAFGRQQTVQPRVMDLNEVIADTDSMLRRIIGEDIELITIPGKDLWNVKIDPSQIEEQVILNLAANAREAMPSGGKLTIEISNITLDEDYAAMHAEVTPGDYVMLAVSDTGIGMTEEVMSHIFEPFFTTKETTKGSGLGLSIIYGIIKQSGGHIEVSSKPGKGTTFRIYLPRVDTPAETARGREPGPLPRGTEIILVAEDEPLVRDLACRILREQGYTVLEAGNGREALLTAGKYADGEIHLLITDVIMPHMSGKDLADHIKEKHPDIKVLFVSGYTNNTVTHHGVLQKGVNFLAKPFTSGQITRTVRRVLDTNI